MRIISPASAWRSLRRARGLAGSTLTLSSGKLGLPPQSNIVVITAVCSELVHGLGISRKHEGAHTHGIGITLRTGSSWSRGVTCGQALLRNTVVVRRLTIVGVIIIAMLAAARRGTARALLLLLSVLVGRRK